MVQSYVFVATPFSWSWSHCFALANHVIVWKLGLCRSLCVTLLVSIPPKQRTSRRFQTTVSMRHLSCGPFFSSNSYAQGNWRTCYCYNAFDKPALQNFLTECLCFEENTVPLSANCVLTQCETTRTELFVPVVVFIVIEATNTFL